jgi:hypothetical protein
MKQVIVSIERNDRRPILQDFALQCRDAHVAIVASDIVVVRDSRTRLSNALWRWRIRKFAYVVQSWVLASLLKG